jgi:chromosome partitioning protein
MDALGSINPVNHQLRKAAPFAELIVAIRAERIVSGFDPFDWVVVKNRIRRCEQRLNASADRDLATAARDLGFRLINGLTERLIYRELLPFGLSHPDLKLIPGLAIQRAPVSHQTVKSYRKALHAARPTKTPVL